MTFPRDQYVYIGGIMRSVALAAAAIVLLEIFWDFRTYWPRLIPWVGSLFAAFVTLATFARGVLLTNSRASLWDLILPTLIGLVEFSLFITLSPRLRPRSDHRRFHKFNDWTPWFFYFACHAALGVAIIQNRISDTEPTRDFDEPLRPLANEYMGWMYDDRKGALIGVAVALISGLLVWWVLRKWRTRLWYSLIYIALTIAPMFVLTHVISEADTQRQRIEEFVWTAYPQNR
jgi:hypothetical protein